MMFIPCTDSTPHFLKYFDLNVAPHILYYSYIPIILIALFLGIYILIKDKFSRSSKFIFAVALAFAIWVLNIIFQWVIVYANISMFSWQITPIIEIFIPISVLYFFYIFSYKKIPNFIKYSSYLVVSLVALILGTKFNMPAFNPSICEATVGPLLYGVNYFEIFVAIYIVMVSLKEFFSTKNTESIKKQSLLLAVGSAIFLVIFSLSNILGQSTRIYSINLFGPIGMLVFLIFLSYLIVKYGAFNIKLIATQALVVGISVLIGAQLFFPSNLTDEIITAVTLAAFLVAGYFLIRSVKREIEAKVKEQVQREQIEHLTSVLSHDVKGFIGKDSQLFLEISEGSFDDDLNMLKTMSKQLYTDGNKMLETVIEILSKRDGKPVPKPFSLKDAVLSAVEGTDRNMVKQKNINIETHFDDTIDYVINADRRQILTNVLQNLVDNSVKYHIQNGHTIITLNKKDPSTFHFEIKDNGSGIAESDKKRIFSKGGHGEESYKMNKDSTGVGLFLAKNDIVAHHGKIWFESTKGVGTTFLFDLPVDVTNLKATLVKMPETIPMSIQSLSENKS